MQGGPIYLIMEYAKYGSLRNYLRASRGCPSNDLRCHSQASLLSSSVDSIEPISAKEVLSYAWQIAKGMDYLSEMKVHYNCIYSIFLHCNIFYAARSPRFGREKRFARRRKNMQNIRLRLDEGHLP